VAQTAEGVIYRMR